MSDSFMDHLPSHEQRRLKRRMSPEAYEKLREKVRGPEDLEKEMKRNENLAEMSFRLESEPQFHDAMKSRVETDVREKGIEQVMETQRASPEAKKNIEQGKFRLAISSHPKTHQDQIVAVSEGKVQEKLPIKPAFSDAYTGGGLQQAA